MPEMTRYPAMSPAAVLQLARFLQRQGLGPTSVTSGPLGEAYAAITAEADAILSAERSERLTRLETIALPGLEVIA